MRFVSIDIETTGLDPEWCQILEIGAVVEDLTEPEQEREPFHMFLLHEKITGSPQAITMNAEVIKIISEWDKKGNRKYHFRSPDGVIYPFVNWLSKVGISPMEPIICAGKNFAGFDRPFLQKLRGFSPSIYSEIRVRFAHRYLDPGTMYYKPGDRHIPSTEECARRAGIEISNQHRALDDAKLIARLIRRHHELNGNLPTTSV